MKKNNLLLMAGILGVVLLGFILVRSRKQTVVEQTAQDDIAMIREQQEAGEVMSETSEVEEEAETSPSIVEKEDPKYTLFYGATCPHCHDVLEWMAENDIEDRIEIEKKEVYNNQSNNQQLTLAAQVCGETGGAGVPFLFTPEKECIIGSTPIIDYLSEELGI